MTIKTNRIHIILSVLLVLLALVGLVLIGSTTTSAEARAVEELTIPKVFGDKMVFQRGESINVYGYSGKEGTEVKVTLGESVCTATVTGGEWLVTLPPMEATFGLTLTVEEVGGSVSKTFTDVAVGEVFLVSGQSNAALEAFYLEDLDEQMALIDNYDNLRLYTASPGLAIEESKLGTGHWHKASRNLITASTEGASRRFSAIGLVVGMRLCDELGPDVPVAIMHSARGASKIRAWLSYDALKSVAPDEAARVDAEKAYYKENNSWSPAVGEKAHVNMGTVCYNTMIAPLKNFKIGGVIWHQGEGDVKGECFGSSGAGYTQFFTALVNSWREHLDSPNLTFYMVQIGSYDIDMPDRVSAFHAQQYDIAAALDGVYLVPTGFDDCAFTTKDAIAQLFIHPARKGPLADRIASVIIEKQYTEGEVAVSALPMVASISWSNRYTIVRFTTPIKLAYGTKVIGFEQYNGTIWSTVSAEVYSDYEIRFYSNQRPKGVRYGFGGPEVELDTGEIYALSDYSTVGSGETLSSVTLDFVGGGSITFKPDDGTVIRMKHPGNLVGITGATVPVFSLPGTYVL